MHLAPAGRHVYRPAARPKQPKPQRGDMCIKPDASEKYHREAENGITKRREGESPLMHLAPAGRYVYRPAARPKQPKPQRGDMCIKRDASEKHPREAENGITKRREGESPLVHLAPAGRHVYRPAARPKQPKPQRGDMCIKPDA